MVQRCQLLSVKLWALMMGGVTVEFSKKAKKPGSCPRQLTSLVTYVYFVWWQKSEQSTATAELQNS
jgi:hypothetical protein